MAERLGSWHRVDLPNGTSAVANYAEEVAVGSVTVTVRWDSQSRREWHRAVERLVLGTVVVQRHGERERAQGLERWEAEMLDPLREEVLARRVSDSRKGIKRLIREQLPNLSAERMTAYADYVLTGEDTAYAVSFRVTGSQWALDQLMGTTSAARPKFLTEIVGVDGAYGSRVSDSSTVSRHAAGSGAEKIRPKNRSYTPVLPLVQAERVAAKDAGLPAFRPAAEWKDIPAEEAKRIPHKGDMGAARTERGVMPEAVQPLPGPVVALPEDWRRTNTVAKLLGNA